MNAHGLNSPDLETLCHLPSCENLSVRCHLVAQGLQGPTSLALHPATDWLLVAEPDQDCILLFRPSPGRDGGGARRFVGQMDGVEIGMPFGPGDRRIRAPGQLVFDSSGRLYVMEGCRGGRLLCFDGGTEIPLNADVVCDLANDRTRRFIGLWLDSKERPVALSIAGAGRQVRLTAERFEREEDGEWTGVPTPRSQLGGCGMFAKADGGRTGAWVEKAAAFLATRGASDSIGGVAVDRFRECVYVSLREEGIVLCLAHEVPTKGSARSA